MKRTKRNERRKILIVIITLVVLSAFVVVSLLSFQQRIEKREYDIALESLLNQADQGKISVQNKLEGYINVLESVSNSLVKADIHSDSTMKLLKETTKISNLDFVRIGIADKNGLSFITNGKKIDVSNRSYFQASLNGEIVVTGSTESKVNETDVFVVSIPVFDEDSQVKGVLYGIMESGLFEIYKEDGDLDNSQYVHLIDRDGNYVFRARNKNTIIDDKNFFKGMGQLDTDLSVSKIEDKVFVGKDILINVKRNEDERLVYMTPIEGSDWYIVSVITKDKIINNISEIQTEVILLTAKIVVCITIFLLIFYQYFKSEKHYIQELDDELNVMDEVFRLAVLEAEKMIFVYDVKKDVLEFMNDYSLNRGIPKVIENAAQRINDYWCHYGNNDVILQEMADSFHKGLDKYECEIVLEKEKLYTYKIYLTNQYDDSKKPIISVGFVEDITAQKESELMLRKEVQLRENLLSDCVGYIEVDLNEDRVIGCSQNILPADCLHIKYSAVINSFCKKRIQSAHKEMVREQFSCENLLKRYEKEKDIVVEYECIDNLKRPYWVECNIHLEKENDHVIAFEIIRNIHNQKMKEISLTKQAELDSLTGIYNRNTGFDCIQKRLNQNKDLTHLFMIMDLDNFKSINDTLGHLYGDKVLKDVVSVMKSHFRGSDIICRLGGDEFIAFLDNVPYDAIDRILSSFLKKMHRYYGDKNNQIEISASIGVVFVEAGEQSLQDLYDKADKALYQVKRKSKNDYQLYTDDLKDN